MIHELASPLAELMLASISAIGGFVLGLAYFASLRRGVAMLISGDGWWRAMVATLLRIGVAAAGFVLAAMFGAAALLGALAGFLLARGLSVRAARRAG